MMKNVIAVAVLLALGLAAFLVFREQPSKEKEAERAAIASVPAEKLDAIRIVRREGTGDKATVEKIALVKKSGEWRMSEPVDYKVVASTVERMADALKEIKVVDVISENPAKHAGLEVDDKTGVEVTALGGGQELAHLVVGKSAGGMTFARLPGKNQVFRLQGSHRFTFDRSVKVLRDKTILDLEEKGIQKLTLKNSGGELVLARQQSEARPEDTDDTEAAPPSTEVKVVPVGAAIENFDEAKAKGLFGTIAKLRARDFADGALAEDKTGLGAGAATAIIEGTKDGKPFTVTVIFGAEGEDSATYVKTSENAQVFLVSSATAKRFAAKAADFARTAEEMKKAAEDAAKAAAAPPPSFGGGMPGGMPGGMMAPGGQQIPPDLMRKIQEQMQKQKQAPK